MPALIIDRKAQRRIDDLVARARTGPVPLEKVREGSVDTPVAVLRLRDRKPGFERPPSDHVILGDYRAAYSVEEQPGGLCSHLSVSVRGRKGELPTPLAVKMIAGAFGVPYPADAAWTEEFDPGEYAINLLSLLRGESDDDDRGADADAAGGVPGKA